jgi:2-oxo-3-hexenedioate decarboxylase
MADLGTIAARLDDAARLAQPVSQLTEPLSLTEAYAVQGLSVALRADRGERVVGAKMGFTSRAKMLQMGVDDVIIGRLTDAMVIEDGGEVEAARFIHPRVEPELAFLLKRPLSGVVTPIEAQAAIEAVAPALELIDSRYQDFRFSLSDVVADNTSAAGFVTGEWLRPDIGFANLGLVMELDGKNAAFGSTAAILGHPLRALVAAARLAASAGYALQPGDIVLAGAATEALPLRAGSRVTLSMSQSTPISFTLTH